MYVYIHMYIYIYICTSTCMCIYKHVTSPALNILWVRSNVALSRRWHSETTLLHVNLPAQAPKFLDPKVRRDPAYSADGV